VARIVFKDLQSVDTVDADGLKQVKGGAQVDYRPGFDPYVKIDFLKLTFDPYVKIDFLKHQAFDPNVKIDFLKHPFEPNC
jgi:hypothetical protein